MSLSFESSYGQPLKTKGTGKTSFQRELESKMKERKAKGLAADITESEDDLASDDELLSGFNMTSKGGGSKRGATWQPQGGQKTPTYTKRQTQPSNSLRQSPLSDQRSPLSSARGKSPSTDTKGRGNKSTDSSPRLSKEDLLFGNRRLTGGLDMSDEDEEMGRSDPLLKTIKKPMGGGPSTWGQPSYGRDGKKSPGTKKGSPRELEDISPRQGDRQSWQPPNMRKASLYDDKKEEQREQRSKSPGMKGRRTPTDLDSIQEGQEEPPQARPRLKGQLLRQEDDRKNAAGVTPRERRRRKQDGTGAVSKETAAAQSALTSDPSVSSKSTKPQATPRRFGKTDSKESPRRTPTTDIFGKHSDRKTPTKELEREGSFSGKKSPANKRETEGGRKTPTIGGRFGSRSPSPTKDKALQDKESDRRKQSVLDFMMDETPKPKGRKSKSKLHDSDEETGDPAHQRKPVPRNYRRESSSPYDDKKPRNSQMRSDSLEESKHRKSPYHQDREDRDDKYRRSPYDERGRKSPLDDRGRRGYDENMGVDKKWNGKKDDKGRKSPFDDRGRKSPFDDRGRKSPLDERDKMDYDKWGRSDRRQGSQDDSRKSPFGRRGDDDGRRGQYDDRDRYEDSRDRRYDDDRGRGDRYNEQNRKSPYNDRGRGDSWNDDHRPTLRWKDQVDEEVGGGEGRRSAFERRGPPSLRDDGEPPRLRAGRYEEEDDDRGHQRRSKMRSPAKERESSYCEEIEREPGKKKPSPETTEEQKKTPVKPQRKEKHVLDSVIDSIADAQEDRTMKYIKPESEGEETKNSISAVPGPKQTVKHKPKPRYGLLPGESLKEKPANFNSTGNIRDTVYQEWYQERMERAKQEQKEKKKKEKELEEKKKKEAEDKILESKASYNAWKEQKEQKLKEKIRKKREEERAKAEKEQKEAEKKREADLQFKSWKDNKDVSLKEKARAKQREEAEKRREDQDQRLQKKKDAEKVYSGWKLKKDKEVLVKQRDEQHSARYKEREEKRAQRDREKDADQAYLNWMSKKENFEKSTKRDFKRRQCDLEESRPAWSPANRTIPFGRG